MQYVSDLDFDHSRPLKVQSDGLIELSVHHFLLVFNSTCNAWPSSATLRDIRLQNLNDLDLTIQGGHSISNVKASLDSPYNLFRINI